MIDWLYQNWPYIAVPLLVFLAAYVVGVWVRGSAYRAFDRWVSKRKVEWGSILVRATRSPFLFWFLILGAFVAVRVSVLDDSWKTLVGKIMASLFVVSLVWVAIAVSDGLLRLYTGKAERLQPWSLLFVNTVRITIGVIGALVLLEIWGAPTTPIILLLGAAVLVAAFAFKDLIANLASAMQLAQGAQIKVGDFIKLESGESGYVVDVNWRNTQMRGLDGNIILIPNRRLLQCTVINYGHPLKKAKEPFRFHTRLHLKELTGLKARNLVELVNTLKEVPNSVIYYHTHHFLEEHHYLTPEQDNDFALWVSDELGDSVLGERLASIDIFSFPTIGDLRTRIVGVIEDYLSQKPDGRVAPAGEEFHFIKSVSVIAPIHYVAHDLREFVEALRKVSVGSLYYHIFESRLRLHKSTNDFSIWISDCLEDRDLADKLAYLDPYNYTLEALRSTVIQLIEKRIK